MEQNHTNIPNKIKRANASYPQPNVSLAYIESNDKLIIIYSQLKITQNHGLEE